jgi:hypothetical protein
VPGARVRVALNAVIGHEFSPFHIALLRAFFRACTNGDYFTHGDSIAYEFFLVIAN